MLGVTSWSERFGKLNCKKRKCLSTKIARKFNEKISFRFTLKSPEISRTTTLIIKKIKNLHLNSESFNELENSEIEIGNSEIENSEIAVNNSLKQPDL